MSRLIYVTENGNDLDGDGTAEKPFLTEDRAELDAELGDVILVYDEIRMTPPPQRRRYPKSYVIVGTVGLAAGLLLRQNPALAVLIVGVVAIGAIMLLDD